MESEIPRAIASETNGMQIVKFSEVRGQFESPFGDWSRIAIQQIRNGHTAVMRLHVLAGTEGGDCRARGFKIVDWVFAPEIQLNGSLGGVTIPYPASNDTFSNR